MIGQQSWQLDSIVAAIRKQDRRVLAKVISLIESRNQDQQDQALTILAKVKQQGPRMALRVGIAGSAGAGKSTLINSLGQIIVQQGLSLAVLTVDPSSALKGGSLLGDAVRMQDIAFSPNVFIRSTPSGEHMGGISRTTTEVVALCEQAGFDVILVESLGSGQVEFQLAQCVDLLFWLTTPGAGDDLQAMKQGVLEWVDGIVITQADRGRESIAHESKAAYEQGLSLFNAKRQVSVLSSLNLTQVEGFWAKCCALFFDRLKIKPSELPLNPSIGQQLVDYRAQRHQIWQQIMGHGTVKDDFVAFDQSCTWLKQHLSFQIDWADEFLAQFIRLFKLDAACLNWNGYSRHIGHQLTAEELGRLSLLLPGDLFCSSDFAPLRNACDSPLQQDPLKIIPLSKVVLIPLMFTSNELHNDEFSTVSNSDFQCLLGVRYSEDDERTVQIEPIQDCSITRVWSQALQSCFLQAELEAVHSLIRPKSHASVDVVTGLASREAFRLHLKQVIGQMSSQSPAPEIFVFAIDLDDFRRVNEALGLEEGDRVLRLVAEIFSGFIDDNDVLARFGGDEFFICKTLEARPFAAEDFASNLQVTLSSAVFESMQSIAELRCHIGCVALTGQSDVNEILRAAGAALFAAKSMQSHQMLMYNVQLTQRAQKVFVTKNELVQAMADDQFIYMAQPLFNSEQQRFVGAELLLRWIHPNRGIIAASEFFESADRLGIVKENDLRLIFKNLDQIILLAKTYTVSFHLNLSAQLFFNHDIIDFAIALDKKGGLPYLHFEITEHALIERLGLLHQFIYRVKAGGSQVWLDDFGVGYSGLRYLDHLAVDGVKIDQSFTQRLHFSKTHTLFCGMMDMFRKLELNVLAEGVETQLQADLLSDQGCVLHQGRLYGPDKTLDAYNEVLQAQSI